MKNVRTRSRKSHFAHATAVIAALGALAGARPARAQGSEEAVTDQVVEASAPQTEAVLPVAPDTKQPESPAASVDRLRPVRYTANVGVASFPRVLALDLMARFRRKNRPNEDLFSIGAGVEDLPPGIVNPGGVSLSWVVVDADARWFPWRWLYVGGGVGYQNVRTDSQKFAASVRYTTASLYVAPKVGALYTFASGLTVGVDLGMSFAVAPKTALSSADGTEDSTSLKINTAFGTLATPFLALRMGYTL